MQELRAETAAFSGMFPYDIKIGTKCIATPGVQLNWKGVIVGIESAG